MASLLSLLEPEEAAGSAWQRLAEGRGSAPNFPEAAVALESVSASLSVFFRGLGGERAVKIAALAAETSRHRLSLRLRLMLGEERIEHARRDCQAIYLPERISAFPEQSLNRQLYFWLAAFFVHRQPTPRVPSGDPLAQDIAYLRATHMTIAAALAAVPGLAPVYNELCARHRVLRPVRRLPEAEREVEHAIHRLLGSGDDGGAFWRFIAGGTDFGALGAPRRYRPFLPSPLWGDALDYEGGADTPPDADSRADGASTEARNQRTPKATRRESDQTDRKDYLALNRFEKLLTLVESLNINRAVEDDDEEGARKALEDSEEIALGAHTKKPSTRLKADLDIAPPASGGGEVSGLAYPEWDYRRNAYRQNYCRVLTGAAVPSAATADWEPDECLRRRIRRVRRQFEGVRPRPQTLRAQLDGSDLDLEAVIRARADLLSAGAGSDRLYTATRRQERDMSVALLADVSLSTDSWIDGRRVLDIEKESLLVLTHALTACGDEHAIFTFTSKRRFAVHAKTVKEFGEPLCSKVEQRIGSLKPGHYTRMGAAIRHVSARLDERIRRHRLLLVITDGKPNDTDHYEGRYGIEDTRRAIQEARRKGQIVFGVTVDTKAQSYFPSLFGRGGYAIVNHAARLPSALLTLYKQLSAAT